MKFEWKYSPKHEKLSASQAKKELKEISVSLDELPLIRRSDPAVRKLLDDGVDVKIDDVIKITRSSKTGGSVPYYRRVIY
jgi:DNA-directed RNA polymerase subunit H (RpoH/RPB5)|tara:strand:- start:106 stop:345 length:240 start_codon:yes stop_codon:yes gene_type:complete